ncbi:hypothetical protein PRZ48_003447 [Zasmidium cellare]|uniref:Uncharacterized protein n=1 Tax=Zasmidium cellare TaxID=395010 RepID=A0ABR0EVQ6_ZASCE|nr:hypothetical protein PRZ48_003447 [Zasmidium cellare]
MQYTSVALSALTLLGVSHAAPAVKRQATLPAPPATQQSIVNLENTIVYLTNDIVQTNQGNAENDFNTADSQFTGIEKSVTTGSCPPLIYQGEITTAEGAITALNTTQNNLAQLSLDLQNTASSQDTINNDYCTAYGTFFATKNYIFTILGTSQNGASNKAVAETVNSEGYDPNKLGQTWTATEVALEALISALNNIPSGQPASSEAKTAFTNAENTIATFSKAADASAPHSCPASTAPGATDPKSAIDDVYVVERTAQSAYSDTTANNGQTLNDFCKIASYMSAVNAYVKA